MLGVDPRGGDEAASMEERRIGRAMIIALLAIAVVATPGLCAVVAAGTFTG
jgi:hypothetical protein